MDQWEQILGISAPPGADVDRTGGTWPAAPKALVRGAQSSMCVSIGSQGNLVMQDYAFASIRMCGINTLTGARQDNDCVSTLDCA